MIGPWCYLQWQHRVLWTLFSTVVTVAGFAAGLVVAIALFSAAGEALRLLILGHP